MENPPLSVTELTAGIKRLLEQNYASIEVIGEVSRLTRHASGHLYFTIKDEHASISAVIWRSTAARLRLKPEEGKQFIFSGHISVYPPRGGYQLIVSRVEAAGAGQMAAEFERRKALFAGRGWFDAARKQPLPRLPKRIGIITSRTGAAFQDVRKVLATRPAWLDIICFSCQVQGEHAPDSIAAAFRGLSKLDPAPDVILLVRGGGSVEDLWCFNDEIVVKAIVDCDIPVVTGIGHEIDTTLADLAADVRAATPSNAAGIVCPGRDELKSQLPDTSGLSGTLERLIDRRRESATALAGDVRQAWRLLQDRWLMDAERLRTRLVRAMEGRLPALRRKLHPFSQRLAEHQPEARLAAQRQRIRDTRRQLHGVALLLVQRKAGALESMHAELGALSPYRVLSRGYALTTDDGGRVLSRAAALNPGQHVSLRYHDGRALSTIESVEMEKKANV